MRHLSFRLPEYLYQELKDFAEPKAMALSESIRFIISEYFKNRYDAENILEKLKDIEEKIGSLPPGGAPDSTKENGISNSDLARIKKALVILGSDSSRTKIPLINLFPEIND
jgi:predicted DNA-binding protein